MTTRFESTAIPGLILLKGQPYLDHRGSFLNAFRSNDLTFLHAWDRRSISQVNISVTEDVGVVRGLHLQVGEAHADAKIVRCLSGRVWDVAVDLRPSSPTFGSWYSIELSPVAANALFIPEGCAHGFQVLEPSSSLLYLHSADWASEAETGVRFDDPSLGIPWPLKPKGLSDRDLALPSLESFK